MRYHDRSSDAVLDEDFDPQYEQVDHYKGRWTGIEAGCCI